MSPQKRSVVIAPPHVHALLAKLHAASLAQEDYRYKTFFIWRVMRYYLGLDSNWSTADDGFVLDKFVALDQDKCEFMYVLARSMNALNVVEVGTSFGVSTIYLALAVCQNLKILSATRLAAQSGRAHAGTVIATEKESTKAARAREHWREVENIEGVIDFREGDMLQTLREDSEKGLPDKIDLVLIDIWVSLALPALKLLKPRLRHGAVVLVDNTVVVAPLYKEFLEYVHDESHGFRSMTVPFSGGFEMVTYLPGESS